MSSISDRTRKLLWSRSGNLCAICHEVLCFTSETGTHVILGDECHICAQNADGPRWNPDLTKSQIQDYDNLILLCPSHHRLVDGLPDEWTVEKLQNLKRAQERRVFKKLGSVSPPPLDDSTVKLQLCSSGKALWSQMMEGGVHAWLFHLGEMEGGADVVAARLQNMFKNNWDLLSPEDIDGDTRLEGQRQLQEILSALLEVGYVVYAGRNLRPEEGHSPWVECIVSFQPSEAAIDWGAMARIWEQISENAKSGDDLALGMILKGVHGLNSRMAEINSPLLLDCLTKVDDDRIAAIVASIDPEIRRELRVVASAIPGYEVSRPKLWKALGCL